MHNCFKQISALLFCAVTITAIPLYGMENEGVEVVEQQQMEEVTVEQKSSAVWHKKRSVRIAAATTAAVGIYALAVRMGKVAVPVVLAGLFAKVAQDAITIDQKNDDASNKNNEIVVQEDSQQNVVSNQSHQNDTTQNDGQQPDSIEQIQNQVGDVDKIEQKIGQSSIGRIHQLFDKIEVLYKQGKVVAEQWKDSIVQTTEEDLKQIHI